MKFAPGTPQSEIKAAENAWMHGPKVDKTAPTKKIPPPEVRPTVDLKPKTLTKAPPIEVRPTVDLKPKTPPPPVKPTPRVITDPVRPTTPMPVPKTPPPPVRSDILTKVNPNSNFQGDTRVPNLNTIGAPMPSGGGGMPAPGTENMPMAPSPTGGAFGMKRGGSVRNKPATKFSSGGSVSKASSRGDGIAQRGKTRGKYI